MNALRQRLKLLFLFMITVLFLVPLRTVHAGSVSLTGQEIADHFRSLVGNTDSRACLKFVADEFASWGATRSAACCARKYGETHLCCR